MKNIQLFTKGENSCEISGRLVSLKHLNGWTSVKTKEEDSDLIWEHRFPDWNISMIRIFNDQI